MAAKAHLKAALGLDSRQWKAGMKDAQGSTNTFQRSIKRVGIAIGAAFGIGAIMRMGRAVTSWASDIVHAAENVGILTTEMMELNRVAIGFGLTSEDIQSAMARMEMELFNAARGGTKLKSVYDDLGLSLDGLFAPGMDPVKRLQMVAGAALKSPSPTGALAELFGRRRGARMKGALQEIVDGMEEIDPAAGRAAEGIEKLATQWDRELDRMKASIGWWVNNSISAWDFWVRGKRNLLAEDERRTREAAEKNRKIKKEEAQDMRVLIEQTRMKNQREEVRASNERAEGVRKENRTLMQETMSQTDKLKSEYEERRREIAEQMQNAGTQEQTALRNQLQILQTNLDAQLEAVRETEEKKKQARLDAILKPLQAERDRLREEMQSVASRTRGAGLMVSGLSRVGGSMGGERPGLMLVDKQLKVAYEQARIQGEIRDTERQILIAVQKGDNDGGGSAGDIF